MFDDLRPAQWSKLIFNATVNAVAALTGLPHDFHFAEEPSDLGNLVRALSTRARRSPRAAGVEFWEDPWEMNVLATQRGQRTLRRCSRTSRRTGATEVELINGALVREAHEHRRPGAAARRRSTRLVKAKEASYS